jgi:redox-sensitive bicupin YhaK (pirin superfamily)
MSWGKLRVWNDDVIAPESGFPMHSHANFEIITIVFEGELTHKDSLGNESVLQRGYIQHMSAGTGITHSEYNNSKTPVELYQLWIAPNKRNIKPHYQEKEIGFGKVGVQELVAKDSHFESAPHLALPINADAKIFYGNLNDGDHQVHELQLHDHVVIYVRTGELAVGHQTLKAGDQLRVSEEEKISIHARAHTEFVMVITW